jgi:hypothetical protein
LLQMQKQYWFVSFQKPLFVNPKPFNLLMWDEVKLMMPLQVDVKVWCFNNWWIDGIRILYHPFWHTNLLTSIPGRANNCQKVGYVSKKGRKKSIPVSPTAGGKRVI